jgi:hypothetical protein
MTRWQRGGLGLLALCVVTTSLYAVARVAERGRFATPYSSYSAGPDGTRALLLLAQELGHVAEPFTRELSHLPAGTLLILSGCRGALLRKLARPERDALLHWVERGGLLIVAGTAELLPESAGLFVAERAHCRPDTNPGMIERWFTTPSPESVLDSHLPYRLRADPVGPPLTHLLPFDVEEPLTLRVGHDSEATELLGSDQGPLALTTPLGRGRIVLLGIPEALTNRGLSEGGGPLFARLLRAFAPRGPVMFDEYHLGMGERRSLVGYLRDAGYAWLLLQLLLAVLALLLASATRLAPARPHGQTPRETRPFAEALADLLARSDDKQGVQARLSGHAIARIARHYHARRVPPERVADWLQSRGLGAVAVYVRRIEQHAERPLLPGESLTQRAQAIEGDETAAIVVGDLVLFKSSENGLIPQEISTPFFPESQ